MPFRSSGARAAAAALASPSMLDMVRLSPRPLFPPGGVDLYRQIALLTGLTEGSEVLTVGSGTGATLEYFVREDGAHGSGVDADGRVVEAAEARARAEGLAARIQFQKASPESLPYRDEIFDVVVGELGFAAHCEPIDAVREMVRVTKPGGHAVLVRLVWKAPVEPARQAALTHRLGARPLMLVEWKRILRDVGVVDVHIEDWSDSETSFRPRVDKPFPDFSEVFTTWEKLVILRRAWSRWGWRGIRWIMEREWEVHRLLSHERILGLVLLTGRKATAAAELEEIEAEEGEVTEPVPAAAPKSAPPEAPAVAGEGKQAGPDEGTSGLPLFRGNDDD